jgi:hypothetical protein
VIQAMQEQDAVLAEIIRDMRVERGRLRGFDDSRLRERVEVLGPEISLNALRDAISTALIDRLGATWDERYGELKSYKDEHGHCNVPVEGGEHPQLGRWVNHQRVLRRRGVLPVDRRSRLDQLGFVWEPREPHWEAMFTELKRYREEHGDCNVPRGWEANRQLATWVGTQRQRHSRGILPAEQKARLDSLGFDWGPKELAWERMFAELKRYKERFGHCNVPSNWKENPQLGMWVNNQRALQGRGQLSADRKTLLDELGFDWNVRKSTWEKMIVELTRFKQRFSHCNVPAGWVENPDLGQWMQTQRRLNYEGKLSSERKALLAELGFVWNAREAAWEVMFLELKRYRDQYGHCDVPQKLETNPQLGQWVSAQRTRQKEGTLSPEKEARLNALGFAWDARDASWEAMFAELKRYRDAHGHCNVLRRENPELAKWVGVQRAFNKTGKLSAARKERLDEIGFVWSALDSAWETMFAQLKRYKDEHGHCNVPYDWPENPRLGRWVRKQRAKKERLSRDRKSRLVELGITWEFYDSAWEARFAELVLFKERFGHCNVLRGWAENPRLHSWVTEQRALQNQGELSEDRRTRLDELGFIWRARESAWGAMFAELTHYRDKHGHCNVPAVWAENRQLGRWVTVQRVRRKRAPFPHSKWPNSMQSASSGI